MARLLPLMLFLCSLLWASAQQVTTNAAVPAAQAHERSATEIIKNSVDAVVLIVSSDASGAEIGQGSGFIVSADGRIATNYHVIKDAHTAIVKLSNGAFFPVEGVLQEDTYRDLAVIKVSGNNLPVLSLADSDRLEIGEHVIAIGSPLGLQNSVSDGMVSGLRQETADKVWIQTTAPVSPGNSGGPLLRMDGTVVGIITWGVKIGQNLNFAIPSNQAAKFLAASAKVVPLSQQSNSSTSTSLTSPSSEASNTTRMPNERIWTSMTSGKDYKIRFDGDYIYTEWVNLPSQLQGTAAFARSEFKKNGNTWLGKARTSLPCQYWDTWRTRWEVRWINLETQIEISTVGESRIEGRTQMYPAGLDCKKGQPKGNVEWQSFTWIPKN